jgi:hypothetical protein
MTERKNLAACNDSRVPGKRERVSLNKKVLDENGNLMAGGLLQKTRVFSLSRREDPDG